jgi:hypothetical protein
VSYAISLYDDNLYYFAVLFRLTHIAYSFVPHDQASLLDLYGGSDSFVSRLSYMHDQEIT